MTSLHAPVCKGWHGTANVSPVENDNGGRPYVTSALCVVPLHLAGYRCLLSFKNYLSWLRIHFPVNITMDTLQKNKIESTDTIEVRSSLEDEETSTLLSSLQRSSSNTRRRNILFIAVLLILGLSVFCNVILLFSQLQGRDLDDICSSHTQLYRMYTCDV